MQTLPLQTWSNVQVLTASHPIDGRPPKKCETYKPIRIGDNVWIGGGAIILAGVTVGDNSVIGAGAVVTRDITATWSPWVTRARRSRDLTPTSESSTTSGPLAKAGVELL
jgi:maltose O-acetyltransferase